MTDIVLKPVFEKVQQVYQLFDESKLGEAKALTLEIEKLRDTFGTDYEKAVCSSYIASCLVDIGAATNEPGMVERGTEYFHEWAEKHAPEDEKATAYYNLANGYFASWKFKGDQHISDAMDTNEHRLARRFYRQAIKLLQPHHYSLGLACHSWTNYGNSLDTIGRAVEAIHAYDCALRIQPEMGMALGNKGVAISYLAPLMSGHTHLFFIEAIRLLKKALDQPILPEARMGFAAKLTQLDSLVEQHGEMRPEETTGIAPTSDFHRFLCDFCARHDLFLNPVSFLGDRGEAFYGDPMFISTMFAKIDDRDKFDRYITFLNEIKQDYVLGRYFLVQSQFDSADIDAVDAGVSLFYPLDYSLQSTYIQLLKAANKQAIAVLDKVAFFIYDYCKLQTPSIDQVSFVNLWGGNEKMRNDLRAFSNPYLFALFTLSRDLSKSGDWNTVYEQRNALTHRFLVLHDMQLSSQPNQDIPRASLDSFLADTISALRIARAAIMYLVLFVEHQEKTESSKSQGLTMPVWGTPMDGIFRHRPNRFGLPPNANSRADQ